ncbi:MAG TPA: hypothetical protein VHR84_18150 [Terriglobales bacterium]|nr:hypothetical protein [Terriglobales bacterium]
MLARKMLWRYYINKEWMLSRQARMAYRTAAGLSVMLFVLIVYLSIGSVSEGAAPVVRAMMLAGILGAAITIVAMEYFWFGFDKSSALKKVFWFCVMLFPPLGPALYCFFVYSRSPLVARSEQVV